MTIDQYKTLDFSSTQAKKPGTVKNPLPYSPNTRQKPGFFGDATKKKPGFSPARKFRAGEKPGFWQAGRKSSLG